MYYLHNVWLYCAYMFLRVLRHQFSNIKVISNISHIENIAHAECSKLVTHEVALQFEGSYLCRK